MHYILNVLCSFVYYTRRMHFRVFKFSISVEVFVVKNSFFFPPLSSVINNTKTRFF